jgi:hypothetical protein
MAVFEVDPTPWLPWGHQVLDGGATRLPRTFYNPAQDPPQEHRAFCIVVIEPPQNPPADAFWRNQVEQFLIEPLNRNVVDVQPSVFGVGLFQLSGPNSRHALVQHGPFHLQNNVWVRFVNHDEAPQNHRAAQGFRHGWLMFLGIHPD